MDVDSIARFGPLAIALGTFLEGETALLLAGTGLALGILDFWAVVAALAGSLAGDQLFFWLGRLKGSAWLGGHPRFGQRVHRAMGLVLKHRLPLLCTYRFIYGLRGAVPFAFGVSGLCWRFFLLANVCTAAFWSTVVSLLAMHAARFLTDPAVVARLPLMMAGAAALAVSVILLRRLRKPRA